MFKFYISEAIKSISRSKFSAIFTILSISFAIYFTLFSVAILFLSNEIEQKIIDRIEVSVFLIDSLDQTEINEIQQELINNNTVKSAKYVSQEAAREQFIRDTGKDFLTVLDVNPLPASFKVRFKAIYNSKSSLVTTISELKKIKNVSEIIYDYDFILDLIEFVKSAKLFIYIISICFVLIALYMVFATSKLVHRTKQNEFETMKLVGAKLSTIKAPILINSIILGLISSLICIIGLYSIFYFFGNRILGFNFDTLFNFTNIIILILGVFFALAGSYLSIRGITLKIDN